MELADLNAIEAMLAGLCTRQVLMSIRPCHTSFGWDASTL